MKAYEKIYTMFKESLEEDEWASLDKLYSFLEKKDVIIEPGIISATITHILCRLLDFLSNLEELSISDKY